MSGAAAGAAATAAPGGVSLAEVLPLPKRGSEEAATDVIICGAGPAGLTLGCSLRLLGVDVIIVDPHPSTSRYSKAIAIMPRSLEMMDLIGVADDIVAAGRPVKALRVGFPWAWQGVASGVAGKAVPSRFDMLLVGQNTIERILYHRYKALGGKILRGARFRGLHRGKSSVAAHIERFVYDRELDIPVPEALLKVSSTTLQGRYLVGADGRRSKVRRTLGVDYKGKAYPQRFWLADFSMAPEEEKRCGFDDYPFQLVQGDQEIVLFAAFEGHRWRMFYIGADNVDEEPTEEKLLEKIRQLSPAPAPRPEAFQWVTSFQVSCRMVDEYRFGHCFLVGDAAHCHSPAGGQGMNTAIQDAANLGWKLAAWLKQEAADSVLDSYSAERVPVARWVLDYSDWLFRQAFSATRSQLFLRRACIRMLCATIPSERLPPASVVSRLQGLSITYARRSPIVRDLGDKPPFGAIQAGDRVPDLAVRARGARTTLLELLRPFSRVYRVLMVGKSLTAEDAEDYAALFAQTHDAAMELWLYSASSPAKQEAPVPCGCWQGVLQLLGGATRRSGDVPDPLTALHSPVRDFWPVAKSEHGAALFLKRDDARAGDEATLQELLKLHPGEVAMLVVRPDGHIAVAQRGADFDAQAVAMALSNCGVL